MPYPPRNRHRDGFPLLEREAFEFYWQLPVDHPISVSERYIFRSIDLRVMLRRITRMFELMPEAKRQLGPILQRKDIIYAVNKRGDDLGYTTWNRDPGQRVISLFKLFDAEQVSELVFLARMRGCRRSKRRSSIVPMHALHGIVLIAPPGGFAPLVEQALQP
jgi:hypothetical protein